MKQIGAKHLDKMDVEAIFNAIIGGSKTDFESDLYDYIDTEDGSLNEDFEIERGNVLEKGDYLNIHYSAHGIVEKYPGEARNDYAPEMESKLTYDVDVTSILYIPNDSEDDDYYLVDDDSLERISKKFRGWVYEL